MSQPDGTRAICTIEIAGGLGNQLFQYAAARALAIRTGSDLHLDVSFYRGKRHRQFELKHFPIAAARTCGGAGPMARVRGLFSRLLTRERVYREPHFQYDPGFESLTPSVRLRGYFQSERYFQADAEAIRLELEIPRPLDPESLEIAGRMADTEPTALHIRRGDYVTNPKASRMFALVPMEYYIAAMERIPGRNPVYVFSDDIAWAQKHLPAVKPLRFVGVDGGRSTLSDLTLMRLAHHHIIANSTFSWWAAWLAGHKKGLTIAPKRWFADEAMDDGDLIPAAWVRI